MAKSVFQELDEVSLEIDHLLNTELAGEPQAITLHAKTSNGGVNNTPLKTIDKQWRRQAQRTFQGRVYEFHIAEALLTEAEANQVYAIRIGNRQHKVPDNVAPELDNRFWRFVTKPTQPLS